MVQFSGMPRHRTPIRRLRTGKSIRPYTVAQLLRASLSYPDRYWAQHVRIRRTAWMVDKNDRKTLRAETTTYEPNTPPKRGHYCSFRPKDAAYDGLLSQCPSVLVACSCQRFCYKWEYALWYRGITEILYSNGEPAIITNITNQVGLCKHLICLGTHILQRRL